MKIQVTSKHVEEEMPLRGFIEQKDLKAVFYTNSNKQITKIVATFGKTQHTFTDKSVFIIWSQFENAVEAYLNSLKPAAKQNVLSNPTRVNATKKRKLTTK